MNVGGGSRAGPAAFTRMRTFGEGSPKAVFRTPGSGGERPCYGLRSGTTVPKPSSGCWSTLWYGPNCFASKAIWLC